MRKTRILILYATWDGQTARIAERIGNVVAKAGCDVTLRRADAMEALWEIGTHDAVIVGASVRIGKHSRNLEERVRSSLPDLASRPNAFYSVSLSAARPGASARNAERCIEQFIERTGWQPQECASFAGALLYRHYNPIVRLVMRFISSRAGGDTDTSRNYEYTDWAAVERFAAGFAQRVLPVETAVAA